MFVKNPVVVDDAQRKYMLCVFKRMFAAISCSALSGYFVTKSAVLLKAMTGGLAIFFMLCCFGIVVTLSAGVNKIKTETASLLLYVYAVLIGCSLAPLTLVYTGASIVECFVTAACFFGVMCLYGYTTQRDLSNIGSILYVGLICLVVSSFINILFLKNGVFQVALDFVGLCIFIGLTAFDIQMIKKYYYLGSDAGSVEKFSVYGALSLYLDFLNIFLHMLRLFGNRK